MIERLLAFCFLFVVLFVGLSYVSGLPLSVVIHEFLFQLSRILTFIARITSELDVVINKES